MQGKVWWEMKEKREGEQQSAHLEAIEGAQPDMHMLQLQKNNMYLNRAYFSRA